MDELAVNTRDYLFTGRPEDMLEVLKDIKLKPQQATDLAAFMMGLEIQTDFGRAIHWTNSQLVHLYVMRDLCKRGRIGGDESGASAPRTFQSVPRADGDPT